MAGTREEKKQAVRTAIYETAIELFERDGYDAVSVGRITAEVGVAKGTFFNHFPVKADILAAWYSDLVGAAMSPPDPSLPLLDRLMALNRQTRDLVSRRPELWRAKSIEAVRTPSLQAAEREADQAYVRAVTRELDCAEFRGDVGAMADLVLALTTGTWRELLVTGRLEEAEPLFRKRLEALLGPKTT